MPKTTPEFRAKLRRAAADNNPVQVYDLLDYGSRVLDLLDDLAEAEFQLAEYKRTPAGKLLDAALADLQSWEQRALVAERAVLLASNGSGEWADRAMKEARVALGLPKPDTSETPASQAILSCAACHFYQVMDSGGVCNRDGFDPAPEPIIADSFAVDAGSGCLYFIRDHKFGECPGDHLCPKCADTADVMGDMAPAPEADEEGKS